MTIIAIVLGLLWIPSNAQSASARNVTSAQGLYDAAAWANSLPSGQGAVIYLAPGSYNLNQTVSFTKPSVSLKGGNSVEDGGSSQATIISCGQSMATALTFQPSSENNAVIVLAGVSVMGCGNTSVRIMLPPEGSSPEGSPPWVQVAGCHFNGNSGTEAGEPL